MNISNEHMKVLFVSLLPYYPEHRDGISKINFNLLKLSSKYDFLSFANESESRNSELENNFHSVIFENNLVHKNKILRFFSVSPLPKIRKNMREKLIEKIIHLEPSYDVIFFTGPQMVEILENLPKGIQKKSVLSLIDSISLYWKRRSQNESSPIFKIIYYIEYIKALHFEKRRATKSNYIHFVSEIDLMFSSKHISSDVKLKCITNGVSFKQQLPKKCINTKSLLFVGNFSYGPNHQAAQFLIEKLMPRLLEKDNSYSLTLVGPNLDPALHKQTQKEIGTNYLGFVNDIETVYDQHDIFLSPLFFGSGIKNKVLEAMYKGLIVVGSTISFDNIPDSHEQDRIIIESINVLDWIGELLILSSSKNLLKISKAAQLMTSSQFSWNSKSIEYSKMFHSIMELNK